jgi:hypothetical protein
MFDLPNYNYKHWDSIYDSLISTLDSHQYQEDLPMDLEARWIWAPGDPAPRNAVMYFRRTFDLQAVPAQADLHISADSRYILYVNGRRLGFGPARNYQYNYQYDTYPVAPYLAAGRNVAAVCVLHWGEGTFQHLVGRGGLIAQLDPILPGGKPLVSDAAWRVKRSQAYQENVVRICCQLAWEEQYNALLEDEGWTLPEFKDAGWQPAVEIGPVGVAPWTHLTPRTIPFLSDEPVSPVHISTLGKARRPDLQAIVHLTPYVAPGDLTANKHLLDALAVTVLHVPADGAVELRKNLPNLSPFEVFLDGHHLDWHIDFTGASLHQSLQAGEHVLLINLQGYAHDKDYTLTANGIPGLSVTSPLGPGKGTWAVAVKPGEEARQTALSATRVAGILHPALDWQPVAPIDTPEADIFMDITASILVEPAKRTLTLPLAIPATDDLFEQQYLVDFGRMIAGWIELEVEAPAGATIDLLGFEAFQDRDMMVTHSMNNTLRYICRAGKQAYTSVVWRGLRYLIVAVHHAPAPVTLRKLSVHLATYSALPQGSFRSSDPRLNAIWDMSAYTLRLCSQDAYMDCPTYEQTMWVGDAAVDALVQQAVYDRMEFVERNLFLAADSLERAPIVNCQVPSGWEEDILPNWSWLWAMACRICYQFTGSLEFARKIYPYLARQAEFVDRSRQANRRGLFEFPGGWHLLDWAPLDADTNATVAHENALAVVALRATAEMAEVAGVPADAGRWRAAAAGLTAAIDRSFWSPEKNAYIDSIHQDGQLSQVVSQPTNVCLLFSEVASQEHAAAIAPFVVEPGEDWVPVGSPFMAYFTGEVLARQKRFPELLGIIRDRWGEMLDKGATTTWETFRGWTEDLMYGMWTRSWCHAWSSSPAFFLSRYILGVSPLEPGFERAAIAPQLCDLTWVEGKAPTPHGAIEVRAGRQDGKISLQVSLPPAVSAEVRLPANGGAVSVAGTPAHHRQEGNEVIVELPAGAESTIVL